MWRCCMAWWATYWGDDDAYEEEMDEPLIDLTE
jgi:hypothetical protein